MIVMLVMFSVVLPTLVSVVVMELARPRFTKPKFRLAGTSFTVPTVSVIVAARDLVVSATEVALIVTAGFAGSAAGAVYVEGAPLAVAAGATVPHPGEHEVPPWVSAQVTPLFAGSFRTVAVYCCVALTGIRAAPGETETLIAGIVMVAEPVLEESATEVAVRVTVRLLTGALAGAW